VKRLRAVMMEGVVYLPPPRKVSSVTVEEALLLRRSIRAFTGDPVRLEDLAMILWAADGVTDARGEFRSAPSAGATFPLEIYAVIGEKCVVTAGGEHLAAGVYKYHPHLHALIPRRYGDFRRELEAASLRQSWVGRAPVSVVICAVFERTTSVYGERGRVRYVPMEVGHAGQNIYLMATALGYGTVAVGAFHDEAVAEVLGLPREEKPLYVMPVGVPRRAARLSFEDLERVISAARR
jgi:SagB-type dehydrogenase family enzyme